MTESEVIEIRLANGKGVALIDADDAQRIRLTEWYLQNGYAAARRGPKAVSLHREVMQAPPDLEIDHINHDRLDCRKKNLRLVTRSQNNQNRLTAQKNNRLGIRGVYTQHNKSGTVSYVASIQLNGKAIYRYGFKTISDAAAAATELRRQHFTHSPECVNG